MSKKWTTEEDNYIRENYQKKPYSEIAKKIGVSISILQLRYEKLGYNVEKKSVPRWTKEEEELLKEYSKKYLVDEIVKKMGRSLISIRKKALKLGIELRSEPDIWNEEKLNYLKKNANKKSINQISKDLNISYHQIKKKCEELNITLIDKNPDWTEEEIQILKKYASTCHYTELTKYLPNRTVGAIGYKLNVLGIEHISEYEYLSEQQQAYIIDNWGKKSMKQLAIDLNVSYSVILRYKNKLNLKNLGQKKKWTTNVIEKLRKDAKTKTVSELAKKYKTSIPQIRLVARKNNIELIGRKKWKEKHSNELKQLIESGKSFSEVSEILGFSMSTISRKVRELGLYSKEEIWSEEDIEILKILAPQKDAIEIAEILDKSDYQVKCKAKSLNIDLITESRNVWTKEEEETLIKLHKEYYVHIISQIIDKSEQAIVSKAKELNIILLYKPRLEWTKEEEKSLAECAKEYTIKELSELFDRSYGSISGKLRSLGINARRSPYNWTDEEVKKLIILANDNDINEISKIMNKSYHSIYLKLKKLNLRSRINNSPWTKEEIDSLINLSEKHNSKEIANILDKSEESVIRYMLRYNLINKQTRTWTKEEEKMLFELWGKYSLETIAKRLNRSESAITNRAYILNLGPQRTRNIENFTFKQIMDMFLVSRVTIYEWMELGLKVSKKRISAASTYSYVKFDDLLEFLKNNQDVWNSNPLDEDIFGVEPDWLIEKRKKDKESINELSSFKKKKLLLQNKYYADSKDN